MEELLKLVAKEKDSIINQINLLPQATVEEYNLYERLTACEEIENSLYKLVRLSVPK